MADLNLHYTSDKNAAFATAPKGKWVHHNELWHVYVPHGHMGQLADIIARNGTVTRVELLEHVRNQIFLSRNVSE
ncbi:hypothetical protein [Terriglobus sp.]|uniref:hypothetical protein n=1 Tax=Terriglobus sp. TaxID=1889013 RepID=UPI003B009071